MVDENVFNELERRLRAELEKWRDVEINICVTGEAGAGKSSFINAIRGLRDLDEGAAETGVTEATYEPDVYFHPENNNIKFWDLPGIGSLNHSDLETYYERTDWEKYDTFLIFTATRFTANNRKMAEKVNSMGKSFFFVRTKIDQDTYNERRKYGREHYIEQLTINRIREDCCKSLEGLIARDKDVFLISNHDRGMWDFHRLSQAILDALPPHQKESLTLSLNLITSGCKNFVKRKVDILNDRIWKIAAISGAGGAVPVPGLSMAIDSGLIINEVNFYKSQLGIPDENSEEFSRLTPKTKEKILKFCLTSAIHFGSLFAAYTASATAEEFVRFVPLVGSAIAASLSFVSTFCFLKASLKELKQTALKVLDEINTRVVDNIDARVVDEMNPN